MRGDNVISYLLPLIPVVDRFQDGRQFSDIARVSTNIIYDRAGNVRAIGAETTSREIERIAEHREWVKVKW